MRKQRGGMNRLFAVGFSRKGCRGETAFFAAFKALAAMPISFSVHADQSNEWRHEEDES